MKGIRFGMDALLNYKRLVEEGVQQELVEIKEVMQREEARLSYLESIHNESIVELKRSQERQMSSLEIDIYYAFLAQTTKEIEKWKRLLTQIRNRYEKKREELISAFKDKRIVETIKEKTDEAYRNEIEKEDRKGVDEILSGGYNRERSSLR